MEVLYSWGDCPTASTLLYQRTLQAIKEDKKCYLKEYYKAIPTCFTQTNKCLKLH